MFCTTTECWPASLSDGCFCLFGMLLECSTSVHLFHLVKKTNHFIYFILLKDCFNNNAAFTQHLSKRILVGFFCSFLNIDMKTKPLKCSMLNLCTY